MRIWKQAVVASAVAASFAVTANGQSVSTFDPQSGIRSGTAVMMGDPDTRIFETMRSAERNGLRGAETKPINAAELARARASGEIGTNEATPGTPQEIVRLQTDSGNSRPQMVTVQPQAATAPTSLPPAQASGPAIGTSRPSGAIVRLNDSQPAGRPQLTEARRAAEHASYEANKRRRASEASPSITGTEQARARINTQARASEMDAASQASASDLARSGIVARERVITPDHERTAIRADGSINDERSARDILSRLR
jgi:hypothetical protein